MKEKIIAIKRIAKSKRPLTLVTLTLLFLFTVPAAIETSVAKAQGLKIQSISEIEEKAKESTDTIINIGKYVVSSALAIGLIFVVYALATSNPHAKEYLIGWIIAVVVVVIAWLII